MRMSMFYLTPIYGETEVIIHAQTHLKLFYTYILIFVCVHVCFFSFSFCLRTQITPHILFFYIYTLMYGLYLFLYTLFTYIYILFLYFSVTYINGSYTCRCVCVCRLAIFIFLWERGREGDRDTK